MRELGLPLSASPCERTERVLQKAAENLWCDTSVLTESHLWHSSPCTSLADAAVLNNVAHTFGLMDTVKKVLDNRKNQTEQGEEQFLYTLAGTVSA